MNKNWKRIFGLPEIAVNIFGHLDNEEDLLALLEVMPDNPSLIKRFLCHKLRRMTELKVVIAEGSWYMSIAYDRAFVNHL